MSTSTAAPAAHLSDQAARDRITGVDPAGLHETLFVEAGAGSGKTRSLVQRVVALVAAGVPMRAIAAITFTEKAAAELRDRVRRALEDRTQAEPADDRWRRALDQVDGAAISTLHAFAQRILGERPIEAGLPPNVEVLDEVASEIEFEERWQAFRGRLLDDPALQRTLLLAFAAGVTLADVRALARQFDTNWDLLAHKVPWQPSEPPAVDLAGFCAELDAVCDDRVHCRDGSDTLLARLDELADYRDRLRATPDEYEALRLLGETKPSFKVGNVGRAKKWDGDLSERRQRIAALGERRVELAEEVACACVRHLAVAVRDFVLDAAEERRAGGRLEFHDLLVLARELLRGDRGPEVRAALRQRYQRLLLDEFQDTDPIQIELAVLLASEDPHAGDQPWWQVPVTPGRLFFVGDPKQSIYRFRRADIGLFLAARRAFGDDPVQLTTNFRTTPPVIDWLNHTFGRLITFTDGSQPGYQPLQAAPRRQHPPDGPPVLLLGAAEHADEPDADELRQREAADVAAVVRSAVGGWSVLERREEDGTEHWRRATHGDVTILIPARTSLAALERALEAADVPYRAETSSLVYATPEVRDLFAALRAVADPTDQLALVSALRSPLFGCGDDDLATFRLRHGAAWNVRAPLPADLPAAHPVGEAMLVLRELHAASMWLAPSELLDRIIRQRRAFELGFADRRPRDLWRRLRFVVDQAREWSEAEGGTLRQYLAWADLQASESTRVAETVLPETDDESVRIMTVHAAKGLEFPITVVSGMTTCSRAGRRGVQVAWPPDGPVGLKFGSRVTTEEFRAFEPIDEQMGFHERLRLLYVACTRAQDHLVVSLHRGTRRREPDEQRKLTNAELLARAGEDAPHQQQWDPAGMPEPAAAGDAERPAAPPLPPEAEWAQAHAAALSAGTTSGTVAATSVARLAVADDPGLDKAPRDLDLPPWIKGRYGTAIGRAVHAVLQTVDLATGEGLAEAVAAQAAAEGVVGREDDVAALARAGLAAPSVQEAARRPRWRETYVAAPVAGRTLEGYIDLLYRSEDGLVVVDYKTAGSATQLDERAAGYRLQGAAYALAVEQAAGEPVSRCVFVFCTPEGPRERAVDDLAAAMTEVRALLAEHSAALGPDRDPGDPAPA